MCLSLPLGNCRLEPRHPPELSGDDGHSEPHVAAEPLECDLCYQGPQLFNVFNDYWFQRKQRRWSQLLENLRTGVD